MLNFFSGIVSYFQILFQFISNAVNAIITFFIAIVDALTIPQTLFASCFSFLGASLLAVFLFSVIKTIINR